MNPKHRKHYAEDGRVCAKEGDCVKGAVLQPWSAFHKDKTHRTGHHSTCKACRKVQTKLRYDGKTDLYVTCSRCGQDLDYGREKSKRICDDCNRKAQAWQAGVYIVVECDDRVWLGGHHVGRDFQETLDWGYWPEGMVVEWWKFKQFVGAYRVVGETNMSESEARPQGLELMQEWIAQGDRLHFKPGAERLYWQGDPTNPDHVDAAVRRFQDRTGLFAVTLAYREPVEGLDGHLLRFVHEPKLTPGLFAIGAE